MDFEIPKPYFLIGQIVSFRITIMQCLKSYYGWRHSRPQTLRFLDRVRWVFLSFRVLSSRRPPCAKNKSSEVENKLVQKNGSMLFCECSYLNFRIEENNFLYFLTYFVSSLRLICQMCATVGAPFLFLLL